MVRIHAFPREVSTTPSEVLATVFSTTVFTSLHHLRVIRSSPPPPRVEVGTAITTVDEGIVSNTSEAIDRGDEVKEDTPGKRQEEGRHRHCGEVRGEGSEEKGGLKQREVLGNRTGYSQRRRGSRE